MALQELAGGRIHALASGRSALISPTGDVAYLTDSEVQALRAGGTGLASLSTKRIAELCSKHFLTESSSVGMSRLYRARMSARHETLESGISLHIIVPTLQCQHTCRYCQVSRAVSGDGFSMTREQIELAADSVLQSLAPVLTVEFQGGDPLLRFDLVKLAIERISTRCAHEGRKVKFVVASTLHQLNEEMCTFFRTHSVSLSTSIDGPAQLHNRNRPTRNRNAYELTVRGIELAREKIFPDSVAALMTVTKDSLSCPEEVVDEYVKLGFDEIFIRPMALYGFAMKNSRTLGYSFEAFNDFYLQCLQRIEWWNRQGRPIREAAASVWMNKLLSPFDSGYVDLQRVTGAGKSVLVYNYDGYVYPSDESRMLAETGDESFRLGRIGEPLRDLLSHPLNQHLHAQSNGSVHPECAGCAFNYFCGPDPVEEQATGSSYSVASSWHCRRSKAMFSLVLNRLDQATTQADEEFLDLAHAWAGRAHPKYSIDPLRTTPAFPTRPPSPPSRRVIPLVELAKVAHKGSA